MSILQQELRKLVKRLKSHTNYDGLALKPINIQNFAEKKAVIEKKVDFPAKFKGKAPVRAFSRKNIDFTEENIENRQFPNDFQVKKPENQENLERFMEKTQKSPMLAGNFTENVEDIEQNTIINVKFDDFPQQKDGFLEKIDGNFMSFKEFAEKNDDDTMKKSDFLDKVKKLSFKEEDYFEKSVRIEKGNSEENYSFEMLNEKPKALLKNSIETHNLEENPENQLMNVELLKTNEKGSKGRRLFLNKMMNLFRRGWLR
jgi:hypothetical protein